MALSPYRRTLFLVIALELWVLGIALYALFKEKVTPSLDFFLILGVSFSLPILLYFVARRRDQMRERNRSRE